MSERAVANGSKAAAAGIYAGAAGFGAAFAGAGFRLAKAGKGFPPATGFVGGRGFVPFAAAAFAAVVGRGLTLLGAALVVALAVGIVGLGSTLTVIGLTG